MSIVKEKTEKTVENQAEAALWDGFPAIGVMAQVKREDVDLTKDNPKLANLTQEDREALERPYVEAQAIYKQVAEKEVQRRDKDKERLYSWTPGTRKKPISNKFNDMLDRYNDPKRRF